KGESLLGWTPARPSENIELNDVLKAAHRVDSFRLTGADSMLPKGIKEAAAGVCEGMSLADLIDKPDEKPGHAPILSTKSKQS
ncbi:MAG: hypothetical protein JKX70_03470, partial [Phycisphaerales bacterium]|nr:hypothetical protein [Phycisphaerales bacterium]